MRSFAHKDIKLSWKKKQKGVKNEFLLLSAFLTWQITY